MKNIVLIILVFCLIACNSRETKIDKSMLLGDDYRLFQDTPAWELAKAVEDENERLIVELIAQNPKLVDFQENKFGFTLLMLTIRNQQFKSFEILLKNKANVHIHDNFEGSTALIEASNSKHYDIKFAETLIQYGANANDVQTDIEKQGKTRTPLMVASKTGVLELVELLVKKGANVNYQNDFKQSALSEAIMRERLNIANYLLNNGANYKSPIFIREEENKKMYLVDVLREDFIELDTEEYAYKMQIVEFLKSKGIDYRASPIPEYIKEKAKEKYPKDWQEYLEKY